MFAITLRGAELSEKDKFKVSSSETIYQGIGQEAHPLDI